MNGNTDSELLRDIRADIILLKMAVMGSEPIKVNGLIQKVDRNTKYIEKDKRLKHIVYGGFCVIIFLISSGLLIFFWDKIF